MDISTGNDLMIPRGLETLTEIINRHKTFVENMSHF